MAKEAAARAGRRTGTSHGALRAAVLKIVQEEPPEAPLSDDAIGAMLDRSQQAVSEARRALSLGNSRERLRGYTLRKDYAVGPGLARCATCCTWAEVPAGWGSVCCVRGHGRLVLSSFRLIVRRPR